MEQSVSRVGHCIDNGPTEGFWEIIKSEMYQMYAITDEESLLNAIDQYLEVYAEERPQERFHCKTPAEVRREAFASANPEQYPIAENKRIQKYKEKMAALKQPSDTLLEIGRLQTKISAMSLLTRRILAISF